MDNPWDDTEFTVCPSCKQVVRREELFNGTHICWSRSEFTEKVITFPDT